MNEFGFDSPHVPFLNYWQELLNLLKSFIEFLIGDLLQTILDGVSGWYWGPWSLVIVLLLIFLLFVLALMIIARCMEAAEKGDPEKVSFYGLLLMIAGILVMILTLIAKASILALFGDAILMLFFAAGLYLIGVGCLIALVFSIVFLFLTYHRPLCGWLTQEEDVLRREWGQIRKRITFFIVGIRRILQPIREWVKRQREEWRSCRVDRCTTWPYGTQWACAWGTYVIELALVIVDVFVEVITFVIALVPLILMMTFYIPIWISFMITVKILRLAFVCGRGGQTRHRTVVRHRKP